MERKGIPGFSGVGIASLLVIFAVLCMGVLAMLSASSVEADRRLGDKTQQAMVDYCDADAQVQQILAQLRSGIAVSGVEERSGVYSYTCPISDLQALAVQVRIEGTEYELIRYQVVSTTWWQAEETLPVWQGDS